MRFKVPQFIDVEDKLFGPLTFKQFVYLAGGAGMIFIIYKILPLFIGAIIMVPIAIITYLLAFQKVNNRPFIHYLQAGISYLISSKLYVWKQRTVKDSDEKAISLTSSVRIKPDTENVINKISSNLDFIKNDEDEFNIK